MPPPPAPGTNPYNRKEPRVNRRPPDLTISIDNGIDRLEYRLCSICETLQTRIFSSLPVVCEDCHKVVTR